jgi:hypothetical protein
MQEDHTLNVLCSCEFVFIIYNSPFTNCLFAELNNVYDVCLCCLRIDNLDHAP